jgi:glycosyltransferase involved in cell wall biosynthesis
MISVCIATYNGEKYIKLQLDSILSQLEKDDEIVIIDDASTDNTIEIINSFHDLRIKTYKNNINIGFVKSFEKALLISKGEIIFFSDQDDYWIDNRLKIMSNKLIDSSSLLLVSQFIPSEIQGNMSETPKVLSLETLASKFNLGSIFFGNSLFFGSTMCIDRKLLNIALPFKYFVKAHDIHLAIIAILLKKYIVINDILTIRTITGNNLSNRNRSYTKKINSRFFYLCTLLDFYIKKLIYA